LRQIIMQLPGRPDISSASLEMAESVYLRLCPTCIPADFREVYRFLNLWTLVSMRGGRVTGFSVCGNAASNEKEHGEMLKNECKQ
jgi:hypothetical protein